MCPFSSLAFLQPTTVDKEPIKPAQNSNYLIRFQTGLFYMNIKIQRTTEDKVNCLFVYRKSLLQGSFPQNQAKLLLLIYSHLFLVTLTAHYYLLYSLID